MAVGVTVEVKLRFESVVSTGRHTREGGGRGGLKLSYFPFSFVPTSVVSSMAK